MTTGEQKPWPRSSSSDIDDEGFETNEYDSEDDFDEDPTFDALDETRTRFSSMSLKKTRPRVCKKRNDGSDEEMGEIEVSQLIAVDEKCFVNVERMIKDGHVNKLKVDQCKVYLRKYGLRLSGKKDVLIGRIREHLELTDGAGEKKYPISSFVINCQGDACTGDVLMFEQKVYEMYNIASRSAVGSPCGTRIVAGRVVKESYGAAKQQHTFTVEVLWSKGEKPLPPLHPLLIKGRNLYRLKTLRQKWVDEEERRKILQEKHARGGVARHSRDVRVREKEMKKNKGKRVNEGRGNNNFMPEHIAQLHPSHKPFEYQLQHPNHTKSISREVHIQPARSLQAPQYSGNGYFSNSPTRDKSTSHSVSILEAPPSPRRYRPQHQICRYYRQGRCYYMENCKFLHE